MAHRRNCVISRQEQHLIHVHGLTEKYRRLKEEFRAEFTGPLARKKAATKARAIVLGEIEAKGIDVRLAAGSDDWSDLLKKVADEAGERERSRQMGCG